jgi:hypothetical protein
LPIALLELKMREPQDETVVPPPTSLLSGAKFVSPSVGAESAQLRFSASLDGFELTVARAADSLMRMIRDRTLRKREKLLATLPITGELLRGTLLERVVRHKSGCPKCARGEGHQVYVLTVGYGRGQTQQISVRKERVAEVRRWLDNYYKLKETIEQICELNHDLLRPDPTKPHPGRKRRD